MSLARSVIKTNCATRWQCLWTTVQFTNSHHNSTVEYTDEQIKLIKSISLRLYCSDYYGCMPWDLSRHCINDVCVAWHKGLKHDLGLPGRTCTRSSLLAPLADTLPLRHELFCRTSMFLSKCVFSENSIVNFVSRHGLYFRRVSSPSGLKCLMLSYAVYVLLCLCLEPPTLFSLCIIRFNSETHYEQQFIPVIGAE